MTTDANLIYRGNYFFSTGLSTASPREEKKRPQNYRAISLLAQSPAPMGDGQASGAISYYPTWLFKPCGEFAFGPGESKENC